MESLTLSINPSYFCNFRCSFCYLSPEQLGSARLLDLNRLFTLLNEVSGHRRIERIDLYGGEIGLLKESYLHELIKMIRIFHSEPISVISNLSIVHPLFQGSNIDLSVSWDYTAREKHDLVYANMEKLTHPFHVLTLASEKIVNLNDQELDIFIAKLNALKYLQTVEIKPYSLNKFNVQSVSFSEYEKFLQRLLHRKNDFKFEFINEKKIRDSLAKVSSSWSDNHLYITPNGDFAVLEFDGEQKEYFKSLENFADYLNWTEAEKQKVNQSPICQKCKYLGHCLSEHLQYVTSLKDSCNGFQGLLNWYENERL